MKRICAVMIGLALLIATPGVATADATHQQAINIVIQRALSQRGVPFAYGGGTVSGPSLGTVAVDAAVDPAAPALGTTPRSEEHTSELQSPLISRMPSSA